MDRAGHQPEIRIEFRATRMELVDVALRLHSLNNGGPVACFGLLALCVGYLIASFVVPGIAHASGTFTRVLAVSFGAFLALILVSTLVRMLADYRERLWWYSFSEDGVGLRGSGHEDHLPWSQFAFYLESGPWFVLQTRGRARIHFIHRRHFAAGEADAFAALLARNVGRFQRPHPKGHIAGYSGLLLFSVMIAGAIRFMATPMTSVTEAVHGDVHTITGLHADLAGHFRVMRWEATTDAARSDQDAGIMFAASRDKGFYFSENYVSHDVPWITWGRVCRSPRFTTVWREPPTETTDPRDIRQRVSLECGEFPGRIEFELRGLRQLVLRERGYDVVFEWVP